jgi:hypothetical protein
MELDCFANWPRSLIKMRYSSADTAEINAPNQVTLIDTTINNFFYAMNSLVSFTTAGGYLTLENSTFTRLSICGSLIDPSFDELGYPELEQYVTASYLTADQISAIHTIWTNQLELN